MANDDTLQILELIRHNGKLEKLIAASRDDNVTVTYGSSNMTLTAFIEILLGLINDRPTLSATNNLISNAIANLIGGAPETLDTLKEIADAIANNQDVIALLTAALENKVDKEEGKGLSSNDFTDLFVTMVQQSIRVIEDTWNPSSPYPPSTKLVYESIQELSKLATQIQNGLMSKEDKTKLDNLPSFIVGETLPEDMKDGDIFIQIVED